MRQSKGYTLIELIIGLSLTGIIMVGVLSITSSMLRFSIQGSTRGDITGWSMLGLDQLNRDLENASFIDWSAIATPDNAVSGCTNWSQKTANGGAFPSAGKIDSSAGKFVTSFYYCRYAPGTPTIPVLLRYYSNPAADAAACPMTPPVSSCGAAMAGYGPAVIAKQVYPTDPGIPIFSLSTKVPNAVHMQFIVGVATPTATAAQATVPAGSGLNTPTPSYMIINSDIRTNTSINGSNWE